jgi:hypothetical protein
MMKLEPIIGVRQNGPLLVFGQTAMFFYLAHRLVLEVPATYFRPARYGQLDDNLRRRGAMLVWLYPAWPLVPLAESRASDSFLRYL